MLHITFCLWCSIAPSRNIAEVITNGIFSHQIPNIEFDADIEFEQFDLFR